MNSVQHVSTPYKSKPSLESPSKFVDQIEGFIHVSLPMEDNQDSVHLLWFDFANSEDANEIRIETLSGVADMESLEKMVSPEEEDTDSEDKDE